jgi:hypothetical protein
LSRNRWSEEARGKWKMERRGDKKAGRMDDVVLRLRACMQAPV